MNKYLKFAAGIPAVVAFAFSILSCKEDYGEPDPFLDVPEDNLNVDYSGLNSLGKVPSVEVGSNVSWEITAYPDWTTPSILKSERGRVRIFFSCEENLSGSDREGLVTFSGAGIEKSFKLKQTLKIEVLELSEKEFSVKGNGKLSSGQMPSFYILDVNSPWTITADDWITPDVTSGEAGQYISVTLDIEENDGNSSRTGSVTVTAGSMSVPVTVRQAVDGVDISITSVSVNKNGVQDSGGNASFTVLANSAWTVEADSWIHVSPESGQGGTSETITLSVDENTTGASRTGKVSFTVSSTGISSSVDVLQSSTMYEDDNILFRDDFSWFAPYIEQYNANHPDKHVGKSVEDNNASGNAPNIYSTAEFKTDFLNEFAERGYVDLRYKSDGYKVMYMQDTYLKFGKTGEHTGLQLPAVAYVAGPVDVTLSFDWCAHMTGGGNIDKVTLTVEVENGGTVASQMPVSPDQVKGELKWQRVSVGIEGLTGASSIKIRPTQMMIGKDESPDQQRWHIDNISIVKAK